MSVDFSLRSFFAPLDILRFRRSFQSNQWLSPERLRAYQEERLRAIAAHAFARVPHYRRVLSEAGLGPGGIRRIEDVQRLPVLSRSEIQAHAADFRADNFHAYRPMAMHTSGSSGRRLDFLLDRRTNAIEFAYYWRHWGWAGYKLGDAFAEFSSTFFLKPENANRGLCRLQRGTGRLLLNSLDLSPATVEPLAAAMKAHGARFLKSLPSVAFAFIRLMKERGIAPPALKAVFSTGEVLFPHQRRAIGEAFGCPVFDSYGHMERVVAACECPEGRLHINSDYGLLELHQPTPAGNGRMRARILATTLYNHSMPLIRYDTGDVAEFSADEGACPCGRGFPILGRVEGREEDVVVTPEGRIVTTLFLAFDEVPGIGIGQIVQDAADHLLVRAVRPSTSPGAVESALREVIRRFVGESLRIDVEFVSEESALSRPGEKFRMVRSTIAPRR